MTRSYQIRISEKAQDKKNWLELESNINKKKEETKDNRVYDTQFAEFNFLFLKNKNSFMHEKEGWRRRIKYNLNLCIIKNNISIINLKCETFFSDINYSLVQIM